METVSVRDGIAYGFKIMVYYVGVVLLGNAIAGIGFGLMAAGADTGFQADPNFGLILLGFIVTALGFVAIFAGFLGALYKLIADAVAKGRGMTPMQG